MADGEVSALRCCSTGMWWEMRTGSWSQVLEVSKSQVKDVRLHPAEGGVLMKEN